MGVASSFISGSVTGGHGGFRTAAPVSGRPSRAQAEPRGVVGLGLGGLTGSASVYLWEFISRAPLAHTPLPASSQKLFWSPWVFPPNPDLTS